MYGNKSLTHRPLSPRWAKFHGLPNQTRFGADCDRFETALSPIAFPSCFFSIGLWSNVSTWLGPPSMKQKMMLLAFGAWCVAALVNRPRYASQPKPSDDR